MKGRIHKIFGLVVVIVATIIHSTIIFGAGDTKPGFVKDPYSWGKLEEVGEKDVNGTKVISFKGKWDNGKEFDRTQFIDKNGNKIIIDTVGDEEKDSYYVYSRTVFSADGTSSKEWVECVDDQCTSFQELKDKNGKTASVGHDPYRRSNEWYEANGKKPPDNLKGKSIPKGQAKPQTDGKFGAAEKVPCGGMSNIGLAYGEIRPGANGKITMNGHNMEYKVDSDYNLTVTGDQVVLIHSSDPLNKINHKLVDVNSWVAGKANVQQGNYGGNWTQRLKNENLKLYADNSDNSKPVIEKFGEFWRVRKKMKYTANVKDLNASDMKDVKSRGYMLGKAAQTLYEMYKGEPEYVGKSKAAVLRLLTDKEILPVLEKELDDGLGMSLSQMDSYNKYTDIGTLVDDLRNGNYDPEEQSHPKIYLTLYIKGTCEVPSTDQLKDEVQGYPDHDPGSKKKWCDLWEQDICPRERDGKVVQCDLDSGTDSCPGCSWEEIKRLRWSNTVKEKDPKIGPDFVGLNEGLRCDDFLNEIHGEQYNMWTEIGDPLTSRPMDSKTPNQRVPLHVNSRPNVRDIWAKNPRSYRHTKEVRAWNPFVGDGDGKQLVLSGLPYTEYWTPLFDAWHSYPTPIDPMLPHLQQYVNAGEEAARSYVRSNFGYNGDLTVYTNAYPSPIHVRYLELRTPEWKEADTNNRFCQEQYSMKVKPGIRNIKKEKWDWYKQYTNEGVLHECVDSDKCKTWTTPCVSRDRETHRCIEYGEKYCSAYYTKVKANPVQLKPIEYLRSEIKEERMPDTPPLYSLRVKFKYRIGANMEFHALTEELGSHITPGIERKEGGVAQPGTVKSGYGVQYDTKFRVTTDYDRDKTWASYPTEWHVLRPNKDVPINFTNDSFIRELQMFDPSVTYDKGKDAPTHSSSKNSTYIEELIMERQRQSISPILRKISENVGPNGIGKGEPGTPRNWIGKTNISHGIGLPNDRYVTFDGVSDPNRYYHAYWGTNGNPNVIPAYTPAPLHFIHLDYRSETNYDIGSVDTIVFRDDFKASAFNNSAIRVMGNMWEDSFVRPGHKTK